MVKSRHLIGKVGYRGETPSSLAKRTIAVVGLGRVGEEAMREDLC